jgi:hypothetical protein
VDLFLFWVASKKSIQLVLPSQGSERTYQVPTKNYIPDVLNPHILSKNLDLKVIKVSFFFWSEILYKILDLKVIRIFFFPSEILSNDEICSSKVMQNLLLFFFWVYYLPEFENTNL